MTWLEPVAGAGHRLRLARLTAVGWTRPVTVVESDQIVANWADVPSVAETAGGVLVAHWARKRGPEWHAYDVMLSRSDDGGATWSNLGSAHDDGTATEHGFVSLLGTGPSVVAIWLDGRETVPRAGRQGPMTLRAAQVRSTVIRPLLLDPQVCDCCSTAAASRPRGRWSSTATGPPMRSAMSR